MSALPLYRETVRPEWIDYNGHMSEAFYVLVFGFATDRMMIETGLHSEYRERTGCSLYTVESHIRYLRDVAEGDRLLVRTRVLGADAKRTRIAHELYVLGPDAQNDAERSDDTRSSDSGSTDVPGPGAEPVATTELLALHVDQQAGRTTPFPDQVRERLVALTEAAPAWAGRSIAEVPAAR
ncbi:thioesterase family protein [Streptomyces sp. RKAG290]|nr:thioesterase family protein [Streptomyces sp. RKAG290]MCM2415808.1 thioesterase family protein [Streptomyces sp. RKAG290]